MIHSFANDPSFRALPAPKQERKGDLCAMNRYLNELKTLFKMIPREENLPDSFLRYVQGCLLDIRGEVEKIMSSTEEKDKKVCESWKKSPLSIVLEPALLYADDLEKIRKILEKLKEHAFLQEDIARWVLLSEKNH